MRALLAAVLLFLQDPRPVPVAGDDLRPGLASVYRGGGAVLHRIDPKPSFTWGDSSPHPRIPPGPFEVAWEGILLQQEPEPLRFGASVSGWARMTLGGVVVFEGSGEVASKEERWAPGAYRVRIEYRSQVPARMRLWWEGQAFAREPFPAWKLKHLPAERPQEARGDDLAARGRAAAVRLGCGRCHASSFPAAPPPGPSLAGLGERMSREAILRRLERPDHAPFAQEAERREIAVALAKALTEGTAGNPRQGRKAFFGLGCVACHYSSGKDHPFEGLRERWTAKPLADFLENPHSRYPDGRMPKLPVTAAAARDMAAFLLDGAASSGPPAARGVVRPRRCAACHEETKAEDVPIRDRKADCLPLDEETKKAILAFMAVDERHASPFHDRQELLARRACLRCHTRDSDRPSPLEEAGAALGGAGEADLFKMPFQRTPRLTSPVSRYRRDYLLASIRDGVSGARPSWYSYRMPAYGAEAEAIVRALAEGDGDLVDEPEPPGAAPADPTLPGLGPQLVGFQGYSCVSCHIWKGKNVAEIEHGSVGPELTSVTSRLRRDWFDRWLEEPSRSHPGTPMPAIFKRGRPATVESILGGDSEKQKEALWAYFARGKEAPDPRSLPSVPIAPPPAGAPPETALIPVHLPDRSVVEGLVVLFPGHDLLLYDVGAGKPRAFYTGAQLLRVPRDRRSFALSGTPVALDGPGGRYLGFERLADGVRVFTDRGAETFRLSGRELVRGEERLALPPAKPAPPAPEVGTRLTDPGKVEAFERPGYRLTALPRPKTPLGEDLVMPGAIAADPKTGRVFVASMKMGELFAIDEAKGAFVSWGGLFQDAHSMVHDGESLYLLHRRNLTRIRDTDGDGRADRFERVAALQHDVKENIDNAYGLVREPSGAFVFTHAVNTPKGLPGWGSALRLTPGVNEKREDLAWGLRRTYGWGLGPEDEIFFTDNQGEWVAANKLCAVTKGRTYGYPNPGPSHAGKPAGKAAVWIPYGWSRSANGFAVDRTGGKFGPFEGQFFLAEMMYGGGILRAEVEKVEGEWQGACFPFWDRGMVGPLVCAFDPKGRLWVGGITDASCGSQPDRGAVFRIDWTGETPFEVRSIRARPRGFRLVFTRPADPRTAVDPASYLVEHYRYEVTGAYGSPELDRTRVAVERVELSADGGSADLVLPALVPDRVYLITARGVRSPAGEPLVHPAGAYTLNRVPPAR